MTNSVQIRRLTTLGGKRILITGGAGGVGRAVARRMVESGARVVIAGRGEPEVVAAVESLSKLGEIAGVSADLSGAAGFQKVFERVDDWLGGLDILIACAGIG